MITYCKIWMVIKNPKTFTVRNIFITKYTNQIYIIQIILTAIYVFFLKLSNNKNQQPTICLQERSLPADSAIMHHLRQIILSLGAKAPIELVRLSE